MGCAGNGYLSTPAMDSLAARGVRFSKAYCPFPLCIPCRASLFAGVMPSALPWQEPNPPRSGTPLDQIDLGHRMREAGYETVYSGKWHVPGGLSAGERGFRELTRSASDAERAEAMADYLRGDKEKPFFAVASFINPHNICELGRSQSLPQGDIETVPLEDCPPLPSNYPIPAHEPQFIEYLTDVYPFFLHRDRYSWDDWRRYLHGYYRLVEKVDSEVGKVLSGLRDGGREEDTLVIFLSDHGDMAGSHQLTQKIVFYEESAAVPLLMAGPGLEGLEGTVSGQLANIGLDVYATALAAAGAELPEGRDGLDLRELAKGKASGASREYLFCETDTDREIRFGMGRMVRSARFKYIVYQWGKDREQFFDLESDPGELVDLKHVRQYRKELNAHRRALEEHCQRLGDGFRRFVPPPQETGAERLF